MSFWEDLQAWTQAQFDALMLANLKRKRKWTAEDINRLLRDRIAKRLKAKKGRAIGAEFLRTAGRIVPPVPLVQLAMESGWLTFENRGGGSLPYVYTYSPTGLTTYSIVPTDITLDGAGSYESDFTRAAYTPVQFTDILSRHRPERYSGLMRLFVQALIGANRTIDDVCSTEIVPSRALAQWNGLVRSPGGAYWHTWLNRRVSLGTTYNSIRARKLKVPTAMADAYAELLAWSGNMSAKDASYLEAYILSSLEYDTSATTRTLIAEGTASLNSMFATGWIFMPWGLCWRHQAMGASDQNTCGAVWTISKKYTTGTPDSFYFDFRRAFLAITFTSELPSATFTVEADKRASFNTEIGFGEVYWTDLTEVKEWFTSPPFVDMTYDDAPVPILSWYGSDGDLHELEFVRYDYTITQDEQETVIWCMTGGTIAIDVEEGARFSGFVLDGVELPDQAIYRGQLSNHGSATASRESADDGTQYTSVPYTGPWCYLSGPVGNYEYYGIKSNELRTWSGTKTQTKSACWALIISDIPGVSWVCVMPPQVGQYETGSGSSTTLDAGYKWQKYRIEAGGTLYDRVQSLDPAIYMSEGSPPTIPPGFVACINDSDYSTESETAMFSVLEWLGEPAGTPHDGTWYSFESDYWVPASPATMLTFQPAVCGYVSVREMFGDNLGTKFDAQAYETLGRLIGGA